MRFAPQRSTADHSKLTATLSRLDHQRTLLARQLAVWTKKQQVTQLRLGVLEKEIMQVGRRIREIGAPYSAVDQSDNKRPIKSEQRPDSGVATVRRDGVSIVY